MAELVHARRPLRAALRAKQEQAGDNKKSGGILALKKTNVGGGGGGGIVKPKLIGDGAKKSKVSRAALENLTVQANQIRLDDAEPLAKAVRKCSRKIKVGSKKATKAVAAGKTGKGSRRSSAPEPMDVDVLSLPEMGVGTAADFIPEGVDNVDEDDRDDPQAASDYVQHIYGYLWQLEDQFPVPEDHLSGSRITFRMRSTLINWLSDIQTQFKLLQETLYLTVDILDRYLAVEASKLQYKHLQLVGVSAMLVACKYEEMYVPEVGDFVFITDNTYDAKEILATELKILRVLNFNFGKPTAINFVRRNSKAGSVHLVHHNLAKYILEECFISYSLAPVKPSEKAAAALLVSLKINSSKTDLSDLWDANLTFYSGYGLASLMPTAALIAGRLLEVSSGSKFRSAYDKYNCASKGHVSRIPSMHLDVLQDFANSGVKN